jgi:hypothetical protein
MPYESEQAAHIAVSRIANSKKVQSFLERCVIRRSSRASEDGTPEDLMRLESLKPDNLPRFVIAIDGSVAPIAVENGFPGAEVGFISVAAVILDVERIRALSHERFPAPVEFERATRSDADEFVLPGSNVQLRNGFSPAESFRHQLFEAIASIRSAEDGESLLNTYHTLLTYKSGARYERCPYEDCAKADRSLDRGQDAYSCSCSLHRPLYSTDALRINEAWNPTGPSGEAYGEAMQVVERLLLINILRTFERKHWLEILKRVGFVIDGPLAVFGHPAWLKDAISKELQRINRLVRKTCGTDLLVLGIEKTGAFMEHFVRLDTSPEGSPGHFPSGTVLLLTDRYIKDHIILSQSERPYGDQTYFGRKFFYKTRSGARIVGMTPFYEDAHMDLSTARSDQFPRLADVLALLDALVSSRYPDAVVPLVEAHAQAAIAQGMGTRVLEQLAKALIEVKDAC